MPNNITLKNGAVVTIGFHENEIPEILEVVRDFCGFEFWRYANEKIAEMTDYETMRFNSDFDAYEGQNEEYADAFREIANILFEYRTKVFEKKTKLYRKDVESMMNAIGGIVDDMI